MLGMTEPHGKHKDTQKAGHCMATMDHKVRRGWDGAALWAASACPTCFERQYIQDDFCWGGRFPVPVPQARVGFSIYGCESPLLR